MVLKKTLLFSLSFLLFVSTNALAQQGTGSSATPPPQRADTPPATSIGFFGGGNYLGIAAEEVTRANMGRYGSREPRGVVVTRVGESSPAGRAGLKAGDVILRFDGEQVTTYRKLQRLISEAAPEQTVRLTISRNGSEQELSVTLARREESFQSFGGVWGVDQSADARRSLEDAQRSYGNLAGVGFGWGRRIGISTTQLTRQLADYLGVAAGYGLLVTSVVEGSPAARAGIKAGDVVTAVDGEKVETPGDLSRAVNRKTEGDVTLTIVRDRNQRSLTVTPEKREPSSLIVTPGAIDIDIEPIVLPSVDIRIPKLERMRPIAIPRITLPQIKINPVRVIGTEPLLIL